MKDTLGSENRLLASKLIASFITLSDVSFAVDLIQNAAAAVITGSCSTRIHWLELLL